MKEKYIHGHKVYYEDEADGGAYHLGNHLDSQEAKVFFDQAKSKGHIRFEDSNNRDYLFLHNSDGTYTIKRR